MTNDAPGVVGIPLIEPMKPDEMKRLLQSKGWKIGELAVRWKISRVRVSQIVNDEQRPLYYDDAIRGLPSLIV